MRLAERDQALDGGRARPERRRAADHLLLQARSRAPAGTRARGRRGRRSGGTACPCRRPPRRRPRPSTRSRRRARRTASPPRRGPSSAVARGVGALGRLVLERPGAVSRGTVSATRGVSHSRIGPRSGYVLQCCSSRSGPRSDPDPEGRQLHNGHRHPAIPAGTYDLRSGLTPPPASPSSTWSSRPSAAASRTIDATLTADEDGTLRSTAASPPTRSPSRTRTSPPTCSRRTSSTPSATRSVRFDLDARCAPTTATLIVDGELTIKGHTRPIEARGHDRRAARDLRRRHEGRPRARGDRRPHRVRPQLERAAAQGRLRARQRRQAVGRPRARRAGLTPCASSASPAACAPDSHNSKLLRAAGDLLPAEAELVEFDGLKAIPPFDEDDEPTRRAPRRSGAAATAIADADAVLIATPEYNHSIPGQLKNALDWALPARSAESPLRNKPAAVVGASHRHVRRGLGPGRDAQGPLRDRRPRDRPRAAGRPRRDDAFHADGALRDPEVGSSWARS